MGSTGEFGSQSSGPREKPPHKHPFDQTQKLEAYFKICQHPNESQRLQLGLKVGLTEAEIRFWFKIKRTLTEAQNGRVEGNALREENERIKLENLAMMKALNYDLCKSCKGLPTNTEEKQKVIDQLKIEHSQLSAEYERLKELDARLKELDA